MEQTVNNIITKIAPGKYKNPEAVKNLINYILREGARKEDNLYGSIGVFHRDIGSIIRDFEKVKQIYHKEDGVRIKHIIVSFSERPDLSRKRRINNIKKTAGYWGERFQVVYAAHEDTEHWHIHLAINSVGYDGTKLNITNKEIKKFNKCTRRIWFAYELDVVKWKN